MEEDIPRRLRRFNRKEISPPQKKESKSRLRAQKNEEMSKSVFEGSPLAGQNVGEKTKLLAKAEVQKFRQQYQREPEKIDLDTISANIYEQLKEDARRHPEEKPVRGRRPRQKTVAKPAARTPVKKKEITKVLDEIKNLKDGDLLAEDTGGMGIKGDELSDIGELSFGPEKKKENKCPNCKAKPKKIVYCPQCGTAYCEKCAKKVESMAGKKKYTCPKCGKSVQK